MNATPSPIPVNPHTWVAPDRAALAVCRRQRPGVASGAYVALCVCLLAVSNAHAQQADPSAVPTQAPETEIPVQVITNGLIDAAATAQTNDLSVVEALGAAAAAQAQAQGADAAGAEDEAASNDAAGANNRRGGTPATYDGRQSRRNRFAREQSRTRSSDSGPRTAASADATNSLDFAAFRIIADLNIFDPNRVPRRPGRREPTAPPTEYFSFVGTMTYEKGTFAFFSGSSTRYEKALKLADSIAGFKVTNIAADTVKLASGTNQFELQMGMLMRRERDGPWHPGAAPAQPLPRSSFETSLSSEPTVSSAAAPSGGEADALKRMMQRRERGE